MRPNDFLFFSIHEGLEVDEGASKAKVKEQERLEKRKKEAADRKETNKHKNVHTKPTVLPRLTIIQVGGNRKLGRLLPGTGRVWTSFSNTEANTLDLDTILREKTPNKHNKAKK